jgi:poly-gamma-glutamate capsule biosynthesis protein CapA/YwtB (metallophosphatase superfamily)
VTAQQPAVKKYIVKLTAEERNRLDVLIQKGKAAARQLLKARILLKADASEAGVAWSDGEIAAALDTSIDTIARTRQKLVEEGLDAALIRKHSANSARTRIFDGAAEAKLIALACSPPPKGRKRWTLTLLETAVVQLNIVDRASDNTIGRTLKKTLSSRISRSNGSSRRTPTPPS